MSTLIVAFLSFFGFILAYNTYGRFISRKVFRLGDNEPELPSEAKKDGIDYVPTNKFVLFGHHFTSIAGTGPIVGPALAIMWGWLPALIWVVFGSIFIGAVHDFTALILSLRNEGLSIGDISAKVLSPSARVLFLVLLAFILIIVVAVFGMVIATLFAMFPSSVLGVWLSLPIAMIIGVLVYKSHAPLLPISIAALVVLYGAIWFGSTGVIPQIKMPELHPMYGTPVVLWILVLMLYCYAASVLPVWLLLQPRDYINAMQLYVAMILVIIGLVAASFTGKADIVEAAPAMRVEEAVNDYGAQPIFPFLFITVACGAVSGFHALVSSGTTSKQLKSFKDAQFIGYGAMLLEGALAVIVIIACTAGIGMGTHEVPSTPSVVFQSDMPPGELAPTTVQATEMTSRDFWLKRYAINVKEMNLGKQVGAFIDGGANFMETIGVRHSFAVAIMAILVVCFAATTIDTATRLLRYILQELGATFKIKPMQNKFVATGVGVLAAGSLALTWGPQGYGSGGMLFWEIFGAGNQLVAGLTLLIGAVYLYKRGNGGSIFLAIPSAVMMILPIWAIVLNIFSPNTGYIARGQYHLVFLGIVILFLAGWFLVEAVLIVYRMLGQFRKR